MKQLATQQWASRPNDERYTSLPAMQAALDAQRERSYGSVVPSTTLTVEPASDAPNGLVVTGRKGIPYAPTHHSFQQLASLAESPAGYLRTLPAPLAADCINYGLKVKRDVEDVGVLIQRSEEAVGTLRAATGPRYGRIWNSDIVDGLIKQFGDGVTGDWRVPGEFGKRVEIDKANTTLYASDRDMFVFLADEDHRIEIPNRRDGEKGTLARGFFTWNSEVGDKTFGFATFLFDYICSNRIVWGGVEYKELRIRHTVSAPERLEELRPALITYANSSTKSIVEAVKNAQEKRLEDKVDEFLRNRFSARMSEKLKVVHQLEEGRPIETLWDVTTAVTAAARSIEYQDERVELERKGGEILALAQ